LVETMPRAEAETREPKRKKYFKKDRLGKKKGLREKRAGKRNAKEREGQKKTKRDECPVTVKKTKMIEEGL